MLFSYGSGLAASMFSVRFSNDTSADSPLSKLATNLSDLRSRLDSRKKLAPAVFSEALKLREETHHLGMFIEEYAFTLQPLLIGMLWVGSCHPLLRWFYAIQNLLKFEPHFFIA